MTTLYAYRFADTARIEALHAEFRAEGNPRADCPVTGWMHAQDGPPWRVVASENREHLDLMRVPDAAVEVYDGDEPTVPFEEWVPADFIESKTAQRDAASR